MAWKRREYMRKKATATAMVMVMGKEWNRPPSWNTEMMAAIPAPRTMPERKPEGMRRTTFDAHPVIPSVNENMPSMSWKLMSAQMRCSPSGKVWM